MVTMNSQHRKRKVVDLTNVGVQTPLEQGEDYLLCPMDEIPMTLSANGQSYFCNECGLVKTSEDIDVKQLLAKKQDNIQPITPDKVGSQTDVTFHTISYTPLMPESISHRSKIEQFLAEDDARTIENLKKGGCIIGTEIRTNNLPTPRRLSYW